METIGRLLVVTGVMVIAVGCVLILAAKSGLPLGRLPGDIHIRGKNSEFYFPIVTSILLSLILTLLLNLISRFRR